MYTFNLIMAVIYAIGITIVLGIIFFEKAKDHEWDSFDRLLTVYYRNKTYYRENMGRWRKAYSRLTSLDRTRLKEIICKVDRKLYQMIDDQSDCDE